VTARLVWAARGVALELPALTRADRRQWRYQAGEPRRAHKSYTQPIKGRMTRWPRAKSLFRKFLLPPGTAPGKGRRASGSASKTRYDFSRPHPRPLSRKRERGGCRIGSNSEIVSATAIGPIEEPTANTSGALMTWRSWPGEMARRQPVQSRQANPWEMRQPGRPRVYCGPPTSEARRKGRIAAALPR